MSPILENMDIDTWTLDNVRFWSFNEIITYYYEFICFILSPITKVLTQTSFHSMLGTLDGVWVVFKKA